MRVANNLFISQPAITYRMKKMEEEFGVLLFSRSRSGTYLTSAGERLFSYYRQVTSLNDEIISKVQAPSEYIEGSVVLGTPPSFAQKFLPSFCMSYSKQYPGINLSIITERSDKLIKQLNAGKVMISIIRGDHPWNQHDIFLFSEPIYILSKEPIDIQKLPYMSYISYNMDPSLEVVIKKWWERHFTSPPKNLIHVDSSETCMKFIEAGIGFSFIAAIRVSEDSTLYKTIITDSHENPYMRQARLLYANNATDFDTYNTLINSLCSFFNFFPKAK